jgi:hypothetical protein
MIHRPCVTVLQKRQRRSAVARRVTGAGRPIAGRLSASLLVGVVVPRSLITCSLAHTHTARSGDTETLSGLFNSLTTCSGRPRQSTDLTNSQMD